MVEVSKVTYYSTNELELGVHRIDLIDQNDSDITLYDAPLSVITRPFNIGDTFLSSTNYTYIEVDLGEIYTGQGSESMTVTVEGVELIDTPTGNYETIKITIISDFTETIMEQHQEKDQNQQNSAAAQQNNLNNNKLNQDQQQNQNIHNILDSQERDLEETNQKEVDQIKTDSQERDLEETNRKEVDQTKTDSQGKNSKELNQRKLKFNEERNIIETYLLKRNLEQIKSIRLIAAEQKQSTETNQIVEDNIESLEKSPEEDNQKQVIFNEELRIIETLWLARNLGPVKITYEELYPMSDGTDESFSYIGILADSNRSLEALPVYKENIIPLPPPSNLEIFTDFETILPQNSSHIVEKFTIGDSPKSVTFKGGSVGGLKSFSQLYHSSENFWFINNGQTATITFETPARDVQFYAANLILNDGKIKLFDTEGNQLTVVSM